MQQTDIGFAKPAPKRLRLSYEDSPESVFHAQVAAGFKVGLLPPVEWTTFPAGGYALSGVAAGRLRDIGLKPGWPDLLLVWDGHIYGLELKVGDGKLSQTRVVGRTRRGGPKIRVGQEEMHRRLTASGMQIAVCRTWPEVVTALNVWGIPNRFLVT